jgi:hypothetical protein
LSKKEALRKWQIMFATKCQRCDYMIVKQARVLLFIATTTWMNEICDFCFIFSCPYLHCKQIYLTYQSSSNSMKISECVPSPILFGKPYKKVPWSLSLVPWRW